MRYAGGYDSSRPWNDATNPLIYRGSAPWRRSPDQNFSGGSLEGLVSSVSQVSEYLEDSGYLSENEYLRRRGYNDGARSSSAFADLYRQEMEHSSEQFEEYEGGLNDE